jgi:splicing factor U2AF subunit
LQEELRTFFEGVMASTGAAVAPGPPISSVKVSSDRSYAFLELRSIEEASNAMAFDGILFNDVNLKVEFGM